MKTYIKLEDLLSELHKLHDNLSNIKTIIIVGPTGSGKTKLAILIAKIFNSVLINADSRQIFKYTDVFTNKDKDKFKKVTIKLIDIKNPDQIFSVAMFRKLCIKEISNIYKNKRIPIIVGGSGYYIDSLIYPVKYSLYNRKIIKKYANLSLDSLQNKLNNTYPKIWKNLNNSEKNNKQRLIKHLSRYHSKIFAPVLKRKNMILIYIKPNRKILYEKLNNRVYKHFRQGIIMETKKLIELGYEKTNIFQSFGYKDIKKYIDKVISKDECISIIQQKNRNYAKRQYTWFNKYESDFPNIIFELNT